MKEANKEEYGVFWGAELYNYNATKVPIIDNLLYENDCICISSKPGVGKSLLAKQILCCLTTGSDFLDTYSVNGARNVLYIQTEGDRAETIERLGNMRKGVSIDDRKWVHINQAGIVINSDVGFATISRLASVPNIRYDVIIIDPLYTTVKGSLKDDDVATEWIRNVRRLKALWNSAVIVLHHDRKETTHNGKAIEEQNDSIFGSVFWAGFFNHNFKLKKVNGYHYLEAGKQRSGKVLDILEMKLMEPSPLCFVNKDDVCSTSSATISTLIKSWMGRVSNKDLVEKSGLNRSTVHRITKKLENNKLIEKEFEGGQVYWVWIKGGGL